MYYVFKFEIKRLILIENYNKCQHTRKEVI